MSCCLNLLSHPPYMTDKRKNIKHGTSMGNTPGEPFNKASRSGPTHCFTAAIHCLTCHFIFCNIPLFLSYSQRTFCPLDSRVLKWWRHTNEISEIMGLVRIFWKNNVQEAYLPKMSISGQIVFEIVAQLSLENSIQTLLNFFWVDPKCLFLASRPLGHCSFRISSQIPQFEKCHFYDVTL